MSAKRLAIIVAPILVLVSSVCAQDYNNWSGVNELSLTAGASFVSTQTITNPSAGDQDPRIHFGNEESIAFNYGRLLKTKKIFGLYAELPAAIYFRMDTNTFENRIPKDIGALFLTPSVRVNIFSGQGVTPWVSVGAGYARFREAPTLNFYGPNPGPTGTNTFAVQFGAGMDVWFWQQWGARLEARDFYSGNPALNVTTANSRQHNYYVGLGVVHRF
ncbi:MAG TPA: hypothetical protein VKR59_20465 [Terriglobales bacterium]|nr:hypothetical protein [Terriglobales bacterium]